MKKTILTLILLTFLISCKSKEKIEIEGNKIVKSEGAYYLYYNKTVLKLTSDIYITKDRKVLDYFNKSFFSTKENDLLTDLKKYFPHGFNGIEESSNVPKEYIEIPTLKLKDITIVDSITLANKLADKNPILLIEKDETKQEEETIVEEKKLEINLESKKIALLNANGINGYARKLGEDIKNKHKVSYLSENYKKLQHSNNVIIRNLNDDEIFELIKTMNLKYVKITEDENLKNEYDAVFILGNDSKIKFDLEIISKSENKEWLNYLVTFNAKLSKGDKYKENEIKDENIIYYNRADRFIARNIEKTLNSQNILVKLVEDSTLDNKIVITVK